MITFINDFRGFYKNNKDNLNKQFPNVDLFLEFVSSEDDKRAANDDNSPFCTNVYATIHNAYHIVYNENLIKDLDLNDKEIWACICHEIGHHIIEKKCEFTEYDEINKEIFCDSICGQLNLQDAMLSALRKMRPIMIESQYNARVEAIQNTDF